MESLNSNLQTIITRITTSKNSAETQTSQTNFYNCADCKDTGMVEGENGFKYCKCYYINQSKLYMEKSGLKSDQQRLTIDNYKPYDELTQKALSFCKKYMKDFDDIKNNRENSLALLGQPGAGKTHLVIAIATSLINRGKPVTYMPYLEAMQTLKQNAMDEENYFIAVNKYNTCNLLIIDDLFKDKVRQGKLIGNITEADMKHIYPIINYRYLNNKPMVISSECTPQMLMELDEALAGRILESCGKFMTVFKGSQYNYRLRNFR